MLIQVDLKSLKIIKKNNEWCFLENALNHSSNELHSFVFNLQGEPVEFHGHLICVSTISKEYQLWLDYFPSLDKHWLYKSEQAISKDVSVITKTLIFKTNKDRYACLIVTQDIHGESLEVMFYYELLSNRDKLLAALSLRFVSLEPFLDSLFPTTIYNRRCSIDDYYWFAFNRMVNGAKGLQSEHRATLNNRRVQIIGFMVLGISISIYYDINDWREGLMPFPVIKRTGLKDGNAVDEFFSDRQIQEWVDPVAIYNRINQD